MPTRTPAPAKIATAKLPVEPTTPISLFAALELVDAGAPLVVDESAAITPPTTCAGAVVLSTFFAAALYASRVFAPVALQGC
jgi:hypothetical protein